MQNTFPKSTDSHRGRKLNHRKQVSSFYSEHTYFIRHNVFRIKFDLVSPQVIKPKHYSWNSARDQLSSTDPSA